MRLIVAVVVCVLAPMVYTLLSLASVVPMTVPIFLGWLAWLQLVHVVAGVALWRRRATLSTRAKAALLSWGGLVFWYWLPAPVYFVLTMNLDELQVAWTALTFFWEVPVVGGAFVLAAQRLYPARANRGPARRYREVMRYPTLVAALLFVFTLAGYGLGTLQLRFFAALPAIEQAKNFSHGIVISLLLAVFFYLALDRMLEPARARIAREAGVGAMVVRTVAGRILGVSLAVTISGFALISLFVLQAFQVMVRESATATLTRDLAHLAESPDTARQLGAVPALGRARPAPAGAPGGEAAGRRVRAGDAGARGQPSHRRRPRLTGRAQGRRRGGGAPAGRPSGRCDLPHRRLRSVAERRPSPGSGRRLGDGRHRRHAGLRQPRVDPGGARPVVRGAPRGGRAGRRDGAPSGDG